MNGQAALERPRLTLPRPVSWLALLIAISMPAPSVENVWALHPALCPGKCWPPEQAAPNLGGGGGIQTVILEARPTAALCVPHTRC